jgi:hypothetical protein
MRTGAAITLAVIGLGGFVAHADEPVPVKVQMAPGEQKVFSMPGLTRLIGGLGKVVDVKPLGKDEFVLYALVPGKAGLLFVREGLPDLAWEVTVKEDRDEKRFKSLCELLLGPGGCAGIGMTQIGGQLVVSGEIRGLETYHRIRKLRRAFPDVVFLTTLQPAVLDALVEVINRELERAGLPGARVSRVAEKLVLEGTVRDENEKRKAALIVEALFEAAMEEP